MSYFLGQVAIFLVVVFVPAVSFLFSDSTLMETQEVAEIIAPAIEKGQFPSTIDIPGLNSEPVLNRAKVQFTIEEEVQDHIRDLFLRYKPDYGAFVALDAETGEILTLVSYSAKSHELGNLALRASFPAASVFKIVTAAAAIEKGQISADTVIPYNGRNHTLYKRNVYHQKENRWTRHLPLRESFGRSINTVFGKIGLFHVGAKILQDYALRFGFNRIFESDIPFHRGEALIADENEWSIAETASGFTRKTKMSPLQGAMIASAVVNDGVMMKPHVVQSIVEDQGKLVYLTDRKVESVAMDKKAARELRRMMSETVRRGTARAKFRPFLRNPLYKGIEVGGKTGSLTGLHPRGKCDWFVGYARFPNDSKKIAFAALTVHEKFWTVRSDYLARRYLEKYSLIHSKRVQ